MQQRQQQEKAPGLEIARLVRRLGSRDEKERQAAEQQIRQSGMDMLELLLPVMRREARKRRMRTYLRRSFAALVFLMFLYFIPYDIVHGKWDHLFQSIVNFYWLLWLVFGVVAVTRLQKNTLDLLVKLDDKRAVGILSEALGDGDKGVRYLAEDALIRLLPTLQASDAALLSAAQRERLYKALEGDHTYLILAILKAFEQVGDAKAIPYVQRLAEGGGNASKEKRVQEVAQECLSYLTQRAEQTQASQTLLRAADAFTAATETLLHPAENIPGAAPEQLLRAARPTPE